MVFQFGPFFKLLLIQLKRVSTGLLTHLRWRVSEDVCLKYTPLGMLRRSCSFSQEANDAFSASVIFLLVPGVSGGTCVGISETPSKSNISTLAHALGTAKCVHTKLANHSKCLSLKQYIENRKRSSVCIEHFFLFI